MNVVFRPIDFGKDWDWIQAQIGILYVEDTTGIIAENVETGERLGACVLDNFTPNAAQGHVMLANPLVLRHGFLEECFECIFNVCKLNVFYASMPSDNKKALNFNRRLGFTELTRLQDGWSDGVDLVFTVLRKENCRYLTSTVGE